MRSSNFLWLIGGVAIGAGCTYLFATRGGRRLQRKLHRRGARLVETGLDWVDGGREMIDRGIGLASNTREFVATKIHASSV